MIDLNTLKLYTKKVRELQKQSSFEIADESEIIDMMKGTHRYKIRIFPHAFNEYHTNAMCRLNIHRKPGKATLTELKSTSRTDCTAVYDNEYNLRFYTPTAVYNSYYAVENILKGDGQCIGKENSPNTYYMELEISQLDRIEFFPSYNARGYMSEYYFSRFSDAVDVSVECDGKEVFSDTLSGLVKYDRVKIVFDKFNKVHLEKFNVETAAAFEQYC